MGFYTSRILENNEFDWKVPLDALDKQFKLLSYLIYLEQLLEDKLGKKIPLLENINTALHTPNDILSLVMSHL